MSTEKIRKLFQEWANTHYLLSELNWAIEDGEYEDPEMQYAWEAWQASRAAIEVDLSICESICAQSVGSETDALLMEVRKEIDGHGISVRKLTY